MLRLVGTGAGHAPRHAAERLTSTQLGFSLRYDAFANMASYAVISVCVVVRVCVREGGRETESERERERVGGG